MITNKSKCFVCAIDLGTTNSGYGFSFKDEPEKVITTTFKHFQLRSLKTATCVLLDPQKKFYAFGFEAEEKYADLTADNEHADWFLFKEFPMVLYDKRDITRKTLIEDIYGKKMEAITIYSHAIKYMVEDFMENTKILSLRNEDIEYVLIVPAIFNAKSKHFMREAATMAGLQEDQVSVVIESEAAMSRAEFVFNDSTKLTTSYMPLLIVDLNERTSTITVLEKLEDGTLEELYYAVNDPVHLTPEQNFLKFLERIFGHNIMKKFIAEDKFEYEELFLHFKRSILARAKNGLHIPLSLRDMCGKSNVEQLIKDSGLSIRLKNNNLYVGEEIVKAFCTSTIDSLISQIENPSLRLDIKALLLVGEFADNPFVKEVLRKNLPRTKVIISEDAVLQGAVMFGHKNSSSSYRFYNRTEYKSRRKRSPIVCAIDFGTTYSCYAFSYGDNPEHVIANQAWIPGSTRLMSNKTPTCVLLDPQKKFVAFGFEAEDKYSELAEYEEHADWSLFRGFKMVLYEREDISRTTLIEDISGKKVEALRVFSFAIGAMVKEFRKALEFKLGGEARAEDIHYVLTVPAIWNDKAKQFMREAATMAKLPGHQVSIALEPEAASIWCQKVMGNSNQKLSNTDSQYMVANLGEGTADITVHEKLEDGSLKKLYRASGGPLCGKHVDQQYLTFLEKILGQDVMNRFIDQKTGDYFELLRDFELKKRSVKSESEEKISFRLPGSLKKLCKTVTGSKIEVMVERSVYSSQVKVVSDKLRVEVELVRVFFTSALDGIILHVRKILQQKELHECKTILLVGGFAECPLVTDAFKKHFPNMKLIVPPDPSLAVVQGALQFGNRRDIIRNRRFKYAYGNEIIFST